MLSWFSYQFIEKRIKFSNKSFVFIMIMDAIVIIVGVYVYMISGIVRDIPELDMYTNNRQKNMHESYCDRVAQYKIDFPAENGKVNVLVIGNSFARDMGNVLLESVYKDSINLSYASYEYGNYDDIKPNRVEESDVILCFLAKNEVPEVVWGNLKNGAKIYGIGTKNFGRTNGWFYKNRNKPDYFEQRIKISDAYINANEGLHKSWGDNYIDFMQPLLQDQTLPVFTPDDKFISYDTRHLSRSGAKYYSQVIDLKSLLF